MSNDFALGSVSICNFQVRGRSNFSSVGEWSEPETLNFRRVLPPTNIQLVDPIRDVTRTQSGNTLVLSGIVVPLEWTLPTDLDSIDGYDVILSRQATNQRFTNPSSDESQSQTLSVRTCNSLITILLICLWVINPVDELIPFLKPLAQAPYCSCTTLTFKYVLASQFLCTGNSWKLVYCDILRT